MREKFAGCRSGEYPVGGFWKHLRPLAKGICRKSRAFSGEFVTQRNSSLGKERCHIQGNQAEKCDETKKRPVRKDDLKGGDRSEEPGLLEGGKKRNNAKFLKKERRSSSREGVLLHKDKKTAGRRYLEQRMMRKEKERISLD